MERYSKYEVSSDGYNQILGNLTVNKTDSVEVRVGARNKLYRIDNKKLLCTNKVAATTVTIGKLKPKAFSSFLAEFKKTLNKQLTTNAELFYLQIPFKGCSKHKNTKAFNKISIGEYFYTIDFNSAYWQMAHKIGYITPQVYNAYINVDDYKQAKRLCFSFLSRKVSAYYSNGHRIVNCDTTPYKRAYDNVRHLLYTHLMECVKTTNGEYIEYNIDSITVNADKINAIKLYLKNVGIVFKITECKKLSTKEFISGNKIVRFAKLNILKLNK